MLKSPKADLANLIDDDTTVYVVVNKESITKENLFLVEKFWGMNNIDQAVIRVFVNQEEAEKYKDMYGKKIIDKIKMTKTSIEYLTKILEKIYRKRYDLNIRCELSSLDIENLAVPLVTIWNNRKEV